MESPDKLYMLFVSEKTLFLIPFCCLMKVGECVPQGMKVVRINGQMKEEESYGSRPYFIFMKSGGNFEFCIQADEVLGILELEPREILELEEPVVYEKNKYLKGAVYREIPSFGQRIIYLIDPIKLAGQESLS